VTLVHTTRWPSERATSSPNARGPSPAEIARTLASGQLPGAAYVSAHRRPFRVRHAVPADGTPLLLTPTMSGLSDALRLAHGETDTAVVLSIDDVRDAPRRGRVWLSGWARQLAGPDARAAALAFATVNPAADLFGVGRGQALFCLELGEVRLAYGDALVDIDLDEFRRAAPAPGATSSAVRDDGRR
jgi:hypothetical protein